MTVQPAGGVPFNYGAAQVDAAWRATDPNYGTDTTGTVSQVVQLER